MLFEPYVCFHTFIKVRVSFGNLVTAYWEIAAHSAYDMFF